MPQNMFNKTPTISFLGKLSFNIKQEIEIDCENDPTKHQSEGEEEKKNPPSYSIFHSTRLLHNDESQATSYLSRAI